MTSSMSPAASIHCPKCGKANPADFKFCLGCGADLAAARAAFDAVASSSSPMLSGAFEGAAQTLPIVPPAPREASPRARGLIHAYTGSQMVKRLLGGIFTLVGLGLFALLGRGLVVDVVIASAGKNVAGKVIDVRVMQNVEVNGVNPRAIRFEYGKERYRGESSTLDISYASALQRGQTVDVEAVPGWPSFARVRNTSVSELGPFAAFFLIFALVGLPLFVSAWRSNAREIRAFKYGTSTVGRVVEFGHDYSVKVNGRHPTRLIWEFDVDGKTFNGSLTHMDARVLRPLVAGNKVPVLYDKNNPKANTVYVP
jgi:hypothetical protein